MATRTHRDARTLRAVARDLAKRARDWRKAYPNDTPWTLASECEYLADYYRAQAREIEKKAMTRWCLDTEFNEDGRTIELISIALVADDGREYYAVSADFDPAACNEWVKANVLPLLPPERTPRAQIAAEIRRLVLQDEKKPEFWAYFADYDWVALCQLYGPMIALPEGFPMFCMDLKQLMVTLGISKDSLPRQQPNTDHSALHDARWVRDALATIDAMDSK